MNEEILNRLRGMLLGAVCQDMENLGNYLQLRLGVYLLTIEAAWRLVEADRVILDDTSTTLVLETLPQILQGHCVQSVHITGKYNDIQVGFDNGIILETVADSLEYEHWKVVGGPQAMIIAGPG